jgi:hypothetical protein
MIGIGPAAMAEAAEDVFKIEVRLAIISRIGFTTTLP